MKWIKILLVALLSNLSLSAQLLQVPSVAYRVDREWHIADDMGNVLYKSSVLLDVEAYSEGLLSGYAFDKQDVVSIYYNNEGKIELVTPSKKAFKFNNNRTFIVVDTGKHEKKPELIYGIIDRKGDYITPIKWLYIAEYSEGLAYLMNFDKRGVIDTNGNFLFTLDSAIALYGFSEGLSPISNANLDRFGYIDKTGKLVIDYIYYEAGMFSEGLARVYTPNKTTGRGGFGFINKDGKLLIDNHFDETRLFKEGYNFVAIYSQNDILRWGVIDKNGTVKADFNFYDCKDFSESIAAVQELGDTLWHYIDNVTFSQVGEKYKYCGSFKDGKAFVVDLDDRKYFINKSGNILFELPKDANIVFDCRTNEKYGKY
ncbi:MAG: WG repeat-containing protein [Bacteroidetes bacterium]|nr:WG repeat-containing protein [Bacteroidota bacterium]